MGSLDPAKLLVILVIALIVLGPERLPKVARQMGAIWRELSRVRDQVTEEVRAAMPDLDLPKLPHASNAISEFLSELTARPVLGATSSDDSNSASDTDESTAAAASVRRHSTAQEQRRFSMDSSDPSMN